MNFTQWKTSVFIIPFLLALSCVSAFLSKLITAKTARESSPFFILSRVNHAPSSTSTTTERDQEDLIGFQFPNKVLPESTYTQVLIAPEVPIAHALREYYDNFYKDPRQPSRQRFLWDPWFVHCSEGTKGTTAPLPGDPSAQADTENHPFAVVPGEREATGRQIQYSLKRTQCTAFFDEDPTLCDKLIDELTQLGKSIGLTAITPPWISMYTDGDLQNFHTDAPHGPMAYVLSLCSDNPSETFQGGETIMLQPQIMDFFRAFDSSRGIEAPNIVRYIPPRPLGRCIAFDPRVPHGVNRVSGTNNDPRKARVVIHGWFAEPGICWFGSWDHDLEEVGDKNIYNKEVLDNALEPIVELLGNGDIGRVTGYLAVRLDVSEDGSVSEVRASCDTIQADMDDFRGVIGYDDADRPVMEDSAADIKLNIFETLKNIHFLEGRGERHVIVPFAFQ